MSRRLVYTIAFNLLVICVFVIGIRVTLGSPIQTLSVLAPVAYPTPLPHICPATTTYNTLTLNVEIAGLEEKQWATVQLFADTIQTTACLSRQATLLPQIDVHNGSHALTLTEVPDGFYKLMIGSPSSYFRDPAGYLFQVQDGQIVRRPDFVFQFRLVPPANQVLPSCWEFATTFKMSARSSFVGEIQKTPPQESCWAERTVAISAPPKQPENAYARGVTSIGYHYIGPKTTQDNQGVWGRNTVVDPNIPHPAPAGTRFVVERVYADNGSSWMEAGWVEISWRDDRQYLYEYDSVTRDWSFYDEFTLSSGSIVETRVYYNADLAEWRAVYHFEAYPYAALLASEALGFTTADNGYNRGEVYTADGVHPILPISRFDKGYLQINGGWEVWDMRYWTEVARNAPYQCDMLTPHHQFNIHSPVVFVPSVLKLAQ